MGRKGKANGREEKKERTIEDCRKEFLEAMKVFANVCKDTGADSRETLKIVCDETGVNYENISAKMESENIESLTSIELDNLKRVVRDMIIHLIDKNCAKKWFEVICNTYSKNEVDSVTTNVARTVMTDPIKQYSFHASAVDLLDRLSQGGTKKEEALEEIRNYAENHSFEETINRFTLLTHSLFKEDIIRAEIEGNERRLNKCKGKGNISACRFANGYFKTRMNGEIEKPAEPYSGE